MTSQNNFIPEQYTPTAITQTKPPVVTITGSNFVNGQRLRATRFYRYPLALATGMEQLNNQSFVVQQATADTFQLWDVYGDPIDARGYTPFVNNGLGQFTRTGPDLFIENTATAPV